MDADADVAIVGAGPVGTVLAILLAQAGRSVRVLERWAEPYALPRAVHFDHEIGRVLQSCGIGPELADISEPAEVYEWRNATGTTLLRFGRVGPGASGWPQSSMFNQPALEELLRIRAEELGAIEVQRGREVTALEQDDDGVTLHHGDTSTRARYVLGCDGANSTVRTLVGAPVHDLGFFYDWLIVDLVLHEPRVFEPINVQVCDPARPTTAVSGGPGRRRWEFMRLPGETREQMNDPATAWALLEAWDVTPADAVLERHAIYTFQARWAERWRTGRVLLAGDAAHQMPPFAGQGMCSGLRDAVNLAWKLDLVLAERAPASLLDAYESERAENVRAVVNFSIELGRVICVPDLAEAALRDEAMSAGVVEGELADVGDLPGITAGVVDTSPRAGSVFVQGRVDTGAGPVRFDDAFGAGWRLVTLASVDADAEWFSSIGGEVVAVDGIDVDGTYAAWFTKHECAAALQRPDFHLFGTAATLDEIPALLARLRTALT